MIPSSQPPTTPPLSIRPASSKLSRTRIWIGLVTALMGLFVFIVGAKPGWFGWDRSPGVGFVQISVFLLGLAIICLGGLIGLLALWRHVEHTITADIGMRLVGTGYVISVVSGIADLIGLGSETAPQAPFFGPLQASGVVIGEVVIAIGFLMLIPYHFGGTM